MNTEQLRSVLEQTLACPLTRHQKVLELGCGDAKHVRDFRKRGYSFFGCDFLEGYTRKMRVPLAQLSFDGYLKPISEPYRLPYADNSFDLVYSWQVLEHVQDYEATLEEVRRVLRPGKPAIHIFPSCFCIVEPHTLIPFATLLQTKAWVAFWALIRIHNSIRSRRSFRNVAVHNYRYLRSQTNYLTKNQILAYTKLYSSSRFDNDIYLKSGQSKLAANLRAINRKLPLIGSFVSTFHMRCLITIK